MHRFTLPAASRRRLWFTHSSGRFWIGNTDAPQSGVPPRPAVRGGFNSGDKRRSSRNGIIRLPCSKTDARRSSAVRAGNVNKPISTAEVLSNTPVWCRWLSFASQHQVLRSRRIYSQQARLHRFQNTRAPLSCIFQSIIVAQIFGLPLGSPFSMSDRHPTPGGHGRARYISYRWPGRFSKVRRWWSG